MIKVLIEKWKDEKLGVFLLFLFLTMFIVELLNYKWVIDVVKETYDNGLIADKALVSICLVLFPVGFIILFHSLVYKPYKNKE